MEVDVTTQTQTIEHANAGDAAGTEDIELQSRIEAVLLSMDRPASCARIAEALGLIVRDDEDAEATSEVDGDSPARGTQARVDAAALADATARIEKAVAGLNDVYERTGRSFRIESISGGLRVLTLPRFAPTIAELHRSRLSHKLSRQAVETLAIIAYKQPITRAQLEAIRGVSCGEVLKSLIERRLITVKGRAEELGRPLLYGTTKGFLDQFGLASVKDLPTLTELKPGA